LLKALAVFASDVLGSREPALVTRDGSGCCCRRPPRRSSVPPRKQSREDIFAEELRLAARALAASPAGVDVEDILDVNLPRFLHREVTI